MKLAKRILFSLLLIIVCSLSWYALQRLLASERSLQTIEIPHIPAADTNRQPLRVGAYNVAHGRGGKLGESNWTSEVRKEGEVHLGKIADQIKAADLDIVILNEVDFNANWSGGYDQAQFVAERAGYRYVAKLTNIDIRLPFFSLQFGNAILSKLPLERVELIELPPVKWWEPILAGKKNAIEATVEWNGIPISFVAIHIETRSREIRLESVSTLINRIQKTNTSYILLGDFNSQRSSSSSTAIDMLIEQHGFSTDINPSTWKTFPSEAPNRGIDWILVKPPLVTRNSRTISSVLSDHLMIVAEIEQQRISK